MVRQTNATYSHHKKKKLFKRAKGFWGDRKNHVRLTKDAVMKALFFSYQHRKKKKRDFRSLWIIRIATAAKANGISYSKLMHALEKTNCNINRKMLSEIAIKDPDACSAIVEKAKEALAG